MTISAGLGPLDETERRLSGPGSPAGTLARTPEWTCPAWPFPESGSHTSDLGGPNVSAKPWPDDYAPLQHFKKRPSANFEAPPSVTEFSLFSSPVIVLIAALARRSPRKIFLRPDCAYRPRTASSSRAERTEEHA